ncbi:MAG TPA: hypothetical protein VFO41_03725 [Alphaproteobacteria bacterium]|nr:hypothetical protein [Alphaproteobacteria bacterium]
MKKTALSLIAVAAFFASSPAGAVDAGCNWSFEDSRPCNGGGSLAFNTVGAYDDQPVPAVIPVADRRQVRKPVYSATCDYNIAGGSGVPIFGKCAETGEAFGQGFIYTFAAPKQQAYCLRTQ